MKKFFAFISFTALFASCAKDVIVPDPIVPEIEYVPVSVAVAFDGDSKATIATMKWEEGDKITVWVKSAMNTPGYKGDELAITDIDAGTFEGQIVKPQATDTYYAAYNASGIQKIESSVPDSGDEYEPVFAIPASQSAAPGGATKAMLKGVFTGAKEDMTFSMKAATAKLKIKVSEPVKNVVFAGMNGEIVATGESSAEAQQSIYYAGEATDEIEFIVPAMKFVKGYKVIYTNASDRKMYQSYASSGVEFASGVLRKVNCTFVPFSIGVAFDKVPMSSYSYYLKGDIAKANSADFETTGENGSGGSGPDIYDEDAKGFFTGNVEAGMAKVVVKGASSAVLPSMTVSEYGYYVTCNQRVDENANSSHLKVEEQKVVIASGLSTPLAKDIQWNVCGEADPTTPSYGHDFTKRNSGEDVTPAGYAKFYAGEVKLNPYIVVDGVEYCMVERGTEGKVGEIIYITGMPHKSNHKDLWYVATQGSQQTLDVIPKVSGAVERRYDKDGNAIDMFHTPYEDSRWDDFCVKSRAFSIPEGSTVNARPVMHGTLYVGYHLQFASDVMNAYFYYDAADGALDASNQNFVTHKDVAKSSGKVTDDSYAAKIERENATTWIPYSDLTTSRSVELTNEGNKTHMNIYMWVYRGTVIPKVGESNTPGYWCRYIKVQYAENPNPVQ